MPSNIIITPLASIHTEGGNVKHFLKANEDSFNGFGEAYFSFIEFGKIKAWKIHTKLTMNLVVPVGNVGFVFYDEFNSSFNKYIIGESNYKRITVPPKIWFGFKGVGSETNLVVNIADHYHDPAESKKKPINYFKYEWGDL
tara:strand:- start:101 stop:523 length:423 start_codon:yes stop_codon:yes gene_type:complete